MAVLDFLFQGEIPKTVTSTVTSQTNLPDWYQEFLRGTISRGNVIAGTPYQAYGGPRVATPGADITSAYDATRASTTAGDALIQQGAGVYNNLAQGFNQTEYDKYMNPYTEGVVNRISELGQRNLTENLLPAVNDTFTGTGQWGSSRHADFTNRAVRDVNESILGQQASALAAGQQAAMGNYLAGQSQLGMTGQALGVLGAQEQAMGLKDAAALQSIGQEQLGQDQKNLDIAYKNFLDQRDYPAQQAQFMSQLIRGLQTPTSTAQTTTAPYAGQTSASPLAQLAGVASGAGALFTALK
jgi:hypothetical protein